MNRNRIPSFTLPESFDPFEFLSPRLLLYADDARYLVSTILVKTAREHVDTLGTVRLKAEYLCNVMNKHRYKAIIESLLEGGAIVRHPYTPGERSFGYTLGERFVNDRHVRFPMTNPLLIDRIRRFHERQRVEQRRRFLPVHHELERRQLGLKIHADQARDILAALPPESNRFDCQGILVRDIETRDFHLNVGTYGRVTNCITSLKREIRKTLHCNGRSLVGVDIKTSQPAFLAWSLLQRQQAEGRHGRGTEAQGTRTSIYDSQPFTPLVADFVHYMGLVQAGDLYEFLLDELAKRGVQMDRDTVKRRLLSDVIAKRKANRWGAEYPSVVEDVFKAAFPTVFRFVRSVNHDGWQHENLIRLLQQAESALVIEQVCGDLLLRHGPMFLISLHDAVYCRHGDVGEVERAFHRAFEHNGFAMRVSVAV